MKDRIMEFINNIRFKDQSPFEELPIKICGVKGIDLENKLQRIYEIHWPYGSKYCRKLLHIEKEIGDNLHDHLFILGKWLLELSEKEKEEFEVNEYNKRVKQSELIINNLSIQRIEEILNQKKSMINAENSKVRTKE